MIRVREFSDFGAARRVLEPWMLAHEAEHGLAIGILRSLESGDHDFGSPVFVAAIEQEGSVIGYAYRTPPYKLALSQLPAQAMPPLVARLQAHYTWIPAVLAPKETGVAFSIAWCRATSCKAAGGMLQRVYAATEAILPADKPPGNLREARESEIPLLTTWTSAFVEESGLLAFNYEERVRRLIGQRTLRVWDHDGPRTMIAAVAPTDNGIRIGHVYTPPAYRGNGYATAACAELTRRLLQDRAFCTLYTDLSNATSNTLYQRCGYRPVADVMDINFVGGADGDAHGPSRA